MIENQSAPAATVVPVLVYADVNRMIGWLCDTFGFSERLRFEHNGIAGHAQLDVAEGSIMMGRQGGDFHAPRPGEVCQYVHITVANVDQHFERAKERGARIINTPSDKPFGERQYTAEDPEGHRWTFSQHIANVPPEQWGAKAAVK